MILASVREHDKEIPVEVLGVFEGSSGRVLAAVKALQGEPFTQVTHGGPAPMATAQIPVGLLHDPHFVPTVDQPRPNLLQLALAHAKERWTTTETIWLYGHKVFLKNDGDYVTLNIVGYRKYLEIFWYDPSGGWKVARDLETKYTEWVQAYKAHMAHQPRKSQPNR